MADIIVMRDWLREKVGEDIYDVPDYTSFFRRHICFKCDRGNKACLRDRPTRCEHPFLVVERGLPK